MLDKTMYTMNHQHARDLSPAQSLLKRLGALDHERSSSALRELFQAGLDFCQEYTAPRSWQRRRLYALLSAMYLEVAEHVERDQRPRELLCISPEWVIQRHGGSKYRPHAPADQRSVDAQAQAQHELITLLKEMIRE